MTNFIITSCKNPYRVCHDDLYTSNDDYTFLSWRKVNICYIIKLKNGQILCGDHDR